MVRRNPKESRPFLRNVPVCEDCRLGCGGECKGNQSTFVLILQRSLIESGKQPPVHLSMDPFIYQLFIEQLAHEVLRKLLGI